MILRPPPATLPQDWPLAALSRREYYHSRLSQAGTGAAAGVATACRYTITDYAACG